MKREILFLLMVVFYGLYGYAKPVVITFKNGNANSRNIGSCKELSGGTLVLTFYVSKYGKEDINPNHKKIYNKALMDAEYWMIREAKKYNKNVYFKNAFIGDCHDLKLDVDDIGYIYPYIVLKKHYGSDYRNILSYIAKKNGCENIIINTFSDEHDVCWAFKDNDELHKKNNFDYIEGCNINFYSNGELNALIAHEMLHDKTPQGNPLL